ncbi:MAG: hypothetical protein DMD81_08020 [Candidatus Rokuibacteriota bacterium]|nr:MAG: hypothetical protein DMD81_08020 [Candidatus Rokubacteria bacterium]
MDAFIAAMDSATLMPQAAWLIVLLNQLFPWQIHRGERGVVPWAISEKPGILPGISASSQAPPGTFAAMC